MKVRLKLIATYQKLLPPGTPGNMTELDVREGITVAEILAPFDVPLDDSSVIVVNGLTVPLETELVENDTVTAFSAIAGG